MSDRLVTPVLCCSSADEKNNLEFCRKLNSETGSAHLNPEHSRWAKVLVNCGTMRNELGETNRHTLVHRQKQLGLECSSDLRGGGSWCWFPPDSLDETCNWTAI